MMLNHLEIVSISKNSNWALISLSFSLTKRRLHSCRIADEIGMLDTAKKVITLIG